MKTTIKILAIIVIISFILFITNDTTSNKTSVGDFWCYGKYCEDIKPSKKDIEASNSKLVSYQNAFVSNGKQVVMMYRMVANDPSSYYKGTAKLRNDTLFLDIETVSRLSYYFDTEEKLCCSPFQFYYTSNVIPKTIYIGDKSIDSLQNQVTL